MGEAAALTKPEKSVSYKSGKPDAFALAGVREN